jgi:hypothetical protein
MSEAKMGKSLKESTKEKMSKVAKGKKKPICKCPNCDKVGGIPQMKRWHFENCKSKSIFNSTRIYENFFVY